MKNKFYFYILFISLFTLSIKWILPTLEGETSLNSLALFNLEDTQYFPIIYSLSEFNFAPTYLDNTDSKIIGFPILGASSCIPPLSVKIRWDKSISLTNEIYPWGLIK